MRNYEFKTISNDGGVFLVCKFYRHPTMGQCHVDYMTIAAREESTAIEIAKQALGA